MIAGQSHVGHVRGLLRRRPVSQFKYSVRIARSRGVVMGHPTKLARFIVLFVLGSLSLLIASHGFTVFATRLGQVPISQSTPALILTPQAFLPLVIRPCPPLKFSDEFDGNTLDPIKW